MNMVRHQAKCEHPMTESLNTFLNEKVKPVAVLVVEEYVLPGVTAKDYMV
jgi:hypothetical protein